MRTLFDNDCRYMSDSELVYDLSNSREVVRNYESGMEQVNLDALFAELTPGRRKVAVAAVEMYKRQQSLQVERRVIRNSRDIFELMQPLVGHLPTEEFWVIAMDNAPKVIKKVRISVGGIDYTAVDIRIVMRVLIEAGATSFALSHNHPSGNIKPSLEDKAMTDRIKKSAEIMGLRFIDHVIVTDRGYYSFADEGIM